MTGPAGTPAGPTRWTAARIVAKDRPTARTVRLRLWLPDRVPHLPGQHCVLRLTAPDGYTAQRSYSLASAPDDPHLELLVEHLPDGEVSGYLAEVARPGDVVEVRGPIGGWFTWDGETPSLCLVGGTGVVPAVAMTRTAQLRHREHLLAVVAVARTGADLPYADELGRYGALCAFTRQDTPGRPRGAPRPDEIGALVRAARRFYVCGSSRFAAFATSVLVEAGAERSTIRIEQFGPTG